MLQQLASMKIVEFCAQRKRQVPYVGVKFSKNAFICEIANLLKN